MQYYRLILYSFFGVLPSLIWLFYYLRKDLHPESKKMIIKIFFFGVLITIPVFFIQIGLTLLLSNFAIPFYIYSAIYWFIIIALSEEFLKYVVLKFAVIKHPEFDEALDTMLYMVIVALGFAALENILYLFTPVDGLSFNEILNKTLIISFVRFVGATFLHTLCSCLLGYFIALSFMETKKRLRLVFLGIFLATFLHGLYDYSIMTFKGPFQLYTPVILLVGLAIFMIWAFNKTKKMKSICKIELSKN